MQNKSVSENAITPPCTKYTRFLVSHIVDDDVITSCQAVTLGRCVFCVQTESSWSFFSHRNDPSIQRNPEPKCNMLSLLSLGILIPFFTRLNDTCHQIWCKNDEFLPDRIPSVTHWSVNVRWCVKSACKKFFSYKILHWTDK